MKATELRVGSWVYNSTTKNNMQVYPMMIPQLCRIEKEYGSLKDSNIKPISLTEEILLKCGFKLLYKIDRYDRYYYHDEIIGIFEFIYGKVQYTIDSNIVCEMEYLHQLQNLFYCLCGFELEVGL